MSKRFRIADSESESDEQEEVYSDESGPDDGLQSESSTSEMSDNDGNASDYSDNRRAGERNTSSRARTLSESGSDSESIESADSRSHQGDPRGNQETGKEEHDAHNGGNSGSDGSDGDSDSLHSMETVEAVKQEHSGRSAYSNGHDDADGASYCSSFMPTGGVFAHALLRGVPVNIADDYGEDNDPSFNAAARTTTRNTPAAVMDAIDRELRFAKPPVTVEQLVTKYNVIKLVIKRRIDHLKSQGHTTAGITMYDVSGYDRSGDGVSPEDSTENSISGEVDALQDPEMRRRLYFDIQFMSPPITVRELAQKYHIHLPTLQARISYLRNKGISTRGIVTTTSIQPGRGRPRKYELEEPATPRSPAPQRESNHRERAVGYKRPPLNFFTQEEDATITAEVQRCTAANTTVRWFALDDSFGRHRGASKQRWQKTLSVKGDTVVPPAKRAATDDRTYLMSVYQELSIASARRHAETAMESKSEDVASSSEGNGPCTDITTSAGTQRPLEKEVQNVIRCMIVSVEKLAHNQAQCSARPMHALLSGTTSSTSAGVGLYDNGYKRKATFSAAEDSFIIQSVQDCLANNSKVVWSHLDKHLGRKIGSSRARWLRNLEQQASKGGGVGNGSSSSSVSGQPPLTLLAKYAAYVSARPQNSANNMHSSSSSSIIYDSNGIAVDSNTGLATGAPAQPDEELVTAQAVLRDMVSVLVQEHNDNLTFARSVRATTTPALQRSIKQETTSTQHQERPFTAQEDAHITYQALKWLTTRAKCQWQSLDARLSRSAVDSCYLRWISVLCKKLPLSCPVSAQQAQLLSVYAVKCDALSQLQPALPAAVANDDVLSVRIVMSSMLLTVDEVHSINNGTHSSITRSNAAKIKTEPKMPQSQPPRATHVTGHGVGRVLKRFTAEEDALITTRVMAFVNANETVKWGGIDKELGRSTGAAKQRWTRVLMVAQPLSFL